MASLAEYLEGTVKVPLSLLTSDGFAECPMAFSDGATVSDFKQFLHNSDQPITGIVTPQTLEDMLQALAITQAQFRQTRDQNAEYLPNNIYKIDCLLGQQCLEKAKAALGTNFKCTVRIYSIPPELPGKYGDGEIYRNLLRHSEPTETTSKVFNSWLARLPAGKQRHIIMLLHRHEIWTAMQALVPFPGLWDDIQIGNMAKHLAAHCDDMWVAYWSHIYTVFSKIFSGLEDQRHLLDPDSVRFLQYKAPSWSQKDRVNIRAALEAGKLLPNLSKHQRKTLYTNICSLQAVIPSIKTFHENLRYITIGLKILERHIAVKPPRQNRKTRPKAYLLEPPESLYKNLEKDWNGKHAYTDPQFQISYVEFSEGVFKPVAQPPSARRSFMGLLLLALRDFPCLGSEPPSQDIKGEGANAYLRQYSLKRLIKAAEELGFKNKKIDAGLAAADVPKETLRLPDYREEDLELAELRLMPTHWRGGKPSICTFKDLQTVSFLPEIFRDHPTSAEPTLQVIMGDLLRAFFVGEFTENILTVDVVPPTFTIPVQTVATVEDFQREDVDMHDPMDRDRQRDRTGAKTPRGPQGKGKLRDVTHSKHPRQRKESQAVQSSSKTKKKGKGVVKTNPYIEAYLHRGMEDAASYWAQQNPVGVATHETETDASGSAAENNMEPTHHVPAVQRIFAMPPTDTSAPHLNPGNATNLSQEVSRPAGSEDPPNSGYDMEPTPIVPSMQSRNYLKAPRDVSQEYVLNESNKRERQHQLEEPQNGSTRPEKDQHFDKRRLEDRRAGPLEEMSFIPDYLQIIEEEKRRMALNEEPERSQHATTIEGTGDSSHVQNNSLGSNEAPRDLTGTIPQQSIEKASNSTVDVETHHPSVEQQLQNESRQFTDASVARIASNSETASGNDEDGDADMGVNADIIYNIPKTNPRQDPPPPTLPREDTL